MLKNVLYKVKKFFGLVEEYEEYEEQEVDLEEAAPKMKQHFYNQQEENRHVNVEKKSAFRFPLIADEEFVPKEKKAKNESAVYIQDDNADLQLPKHLQTSQVYDVEISGIKELLAKRNKRSIIQQADRPTIRAVRLTNEEEQFLTKQQARPSRKEVEKPKQQVEQPIHRKRFIPTNVPSPVHGYRTPKSIEELLPNYKKEESLPIVEQRQGVIEERTVIVEEQSTMKQPTLGETLNKAWSSTSSLSEPTTFSEEDVSSVNVTDDLRVQNVTIENSHVHIQEVHIQQEQVEQHVLEPTMEQQQVQENEIEEKEGSRIPFNVVMLPSDKKKLHGVVAKQQLQAIVTPPQEEKNSEVAPTKAIEKEEMFIPLQEKTVEQMNVENVPTLQEPVTARPIISPTEEVKMDAQTSKYNYMYEKPPQTILLPPEQKTEDWAWMDEQADYLIAALASHQVQAQIESIVQGPAVTQFEITVAQGTKVSKVRNLSDDIKLALAAKDIRIDAPIPGKRTIGIEIPNRISRAVRLSEITNSEAFLQSDSPLEAALGLDLTGQPVTLDLRKMPHGLIAGATGSGKSVCINSILVSLLYKAAPHELKLMLIDPKMVELAPFNHIPHLVSPVITDVKAATAALKWAVEEMERRYALFMHAGARDITRYNQQAEAAGQLSNKLPYILIVIDELADLMMMSPADVEEAICRIAQKARACGIHLIVATQRPSVDVITGLIKSNIPTRIAFAVSSAVDSRTILDTQGAERLLGRGDMLYLGNGMPAPIRLQGTFVSDDEIEEIIAYVRSQGEPNYFFEHEELLKKAEAIEEHDELFAQVCRFVYEQGTASTSSIQRHYRIGYNRAARLVDLLERYGFVSEQRGSKPREVFIKPSDLENL